MKISTRIVGGFTLLFLLALGCGIAGFNGVRSLSQSLTFLSGPAWATADGAMEGSIGVEAQMLGVTRIITQTGDQDAAQRLLTDGKTMAEEALGRMLDTGLVEESEQARVRRVLADYEGERDKVLSDYRRFAQIHRQLSTNFFNFQKLMELAEELGDGAVEELRNKPNQQISWASGLEEKWSAADGAMEAQIGLLQRIYYYERLVTGLDTSSDLKGLESALAFLDGSIREIIEHPLFRKEIVKTGAFAGISFSSALDASYAQHKKDFEQGVDAFVTYRQQLMAYNRKADEFLSYLEQVEESGDGMVENESENIASTINTSYWLVVVSLILCFGVAVIGGGFVARSIINPMQRVMLAMEDLAEGEGDLTQRIEYESRDEIGKTAVAVNKLIGKIENVVRDVRLAVDGIGASSDAILSGNRRLSQRTEEQASSLEETASSMEELTATVRANAQNAGKASSLAQETTNLANRGTEIVHQSIEAMDRINESSLQIRDIVGVIDEIVFQTNLLSLNASVEAARAGEYGRGFAVVANEVGMLARRCTEQSKAIKALISHCLESVDAGTRLADESGKALADISSAVHEVSNLVAEIATACSEQSAGIDQINRSVVQIEDFTQKNAAVAEQTSAESNAMRQLAVQLNELVSYFKVRDFTVRTASKTPQDAGRMFANQGQAGEQGYRSRTAAAV